MITLVNTAYYELTTHRWLNSRNIFNRADTASVKLIPCPCPDCFVIDPLHQFGSRVKLIKIGELMKNFHGSHFLKTFSISHYLTLIKAWCGQKILFGIWSRQRTPFTGRSDNLFHFAKTNIAVNWNLKFPWEQGWGSTHWTFDFMNFSFEFRVKTEDYREQKRCNQCKDIKYARG